MTMKFTETKIYGVFVIELEKHEDDRGWFARAWCCEEFTAHGLPTDLAQTNLSHNAQRGTVRGMHFQTAPHAEAKLVRCIAGAVHDIALDLRPESPTFKQSVATELSADNGRAVFLPEGIAHHVVEVEGGAAGAIEEVRVADTGEDSTPVGARTGVLGGRRTSDASELVDLGLMKDERRHEA